MTIVHVTRWPLITQCLAIALVVFLGLDGFLLRKGLRAHTNTVAVDAAVLSPASPIAGSGLADSVPARNATMRTPVVRATPAAPTRTPPPTTPARNRAAATRLAATAAPAAIQPPARTRPAAIALASSDPSAVISPAPVRPRRSRRIATSLQDAGPLDAPESPRPVLVGTIMKQSGDLALIEFPDGHTRLLRVGEQVGDLILRSVTAGEALFSNTEGGRVILRTTAIGATP